MIDLKTARRIGYQQALKAITVGLIIAYAVMATFAAGGVFWLFKGPYATTLLLTALALYGISYLIGRLSGMFILFKRYPALLVGIVSGFETVGMATLIGNLIEFFQQELTSYAQHAFTFEEQIGKPILMVWGYGFFPIIAVGIWYGWSVKRRGRTIQSIPETQIT